MLRSCFAFVAVGTLLCPLSMAQHSDVDLSGFRMGMSPTEVRHTIGSGYRELPLPVGDPHLTLFAEQRGKPEQDTFYFSFFDNKLVGVSHILNFAAGEQPAYDETMADMRNKFGRYLPPVPGIGDGTLLYRFENGQPVHYAQNQEPPNCPQDNVTGINQTFGQKYHLPGFFALPPGNTVCWHMTQIQALIFGQDHGLVSQMRLTMTNEAPIHAVLVAAQQQKDNTQKKEVDAAKQRRAPL